MGKIFSFSSALARQSLPVAQALPQSIFFSPVTSRLSQGFQRGKDRFSRSACDPNGAVQALKAVITAHPAAAPIFLMKALSAVFSSTFTAGIVSTTNPQARAENLKRAIEEGDEDTVFILMQQIGRGNVYAVQAACDLIAEGAKLAPQVLEELASVDLTALKQMATNWNLPLSANRQTILALRRLAQTVDIDEIRGSVANYDITLHTRILKGTPKEQERGRKLFFADPQAIAYMADQAARPEPSAYDSWNYLMQVLEEAQKKKSQQENIAVIDAICSSIGEKALTRLLDFVKGVEDPDSWIARDVAKFFRILIGQNHHKAAAEALKTWVGHPQAEHLKLQLGLKPPTRITQNISRTTTADLKPEFEPIRGPRTRTPRGIGGENRHPSGPMRRLNPDGSEAELPVASPPPSDRRRVKMQALERLKTEDDTEDAVTQKIELASLQPPAPPRSK